MYDDSKLYFLYGLTAGLFGLFLFIFVLSLIPSEEQSKCELKLTREQNCVSVYVPENLVNDVNQLIMGNTK